MITTTIEKRRLLSKARLDPDHYTLALLEAGHRAGLINQSTLDDIKSQLMGLLRDLILRYTRGESTSVKTETAQNLLLSILYSIDTYISSYPHPEEALVLLQAHPLQETYDKGLAQLNLCFNATHSFFQALQANKLDFPNQAYHATLDEALPDFFKNYDILFRAQDTMASIDYPLLFDDMHKQGILYIQQYLEHLAIENEFCQLFPQQDVKQLLSNYGRVYRIDTSEALINLFEIVLTNSLFSFLAGNKARELSLSKLQYEMVREKFSSLTSDQCSLLFAEAIPALIADLGIDNARLNNYISDFQKVLLPRFWNALEHNCLANVIILDSKANSALDIVFDEGKTMDDDSFRAVVAEIMDCSKADDKTALINSKIHSLGDFIDLLEADCLFDDEYQHLFASLGDLELSILAKIVFAEELRIDGSFSLQRVGEELMEIPWQHELARFFHHLSSDQLKSIDSYIHSSFQPLDASGFLDF